MPNYIKEPRYIQKFTVRIGTISSVIDMMRYDSAWPASEEDSRKLERVMSMGGNPSPEDRVVTFLRAGRNANGPTEARWASFGCEVLHVFEVRSGQFLSSPNA